MQRTARAIAATYRHIYELIHRAESGYPNPGSVVTHSPEEVDTLLDVA